MNLTCDVALFNANLDLLERKPFNVTLTESHSMKHIKDGEVPVGDSELLVADGDAECRSCDGYTDIVCITMNGCWEEIVVGVVALLLVVALLYCCFCKCVPCKLMNCCIKNAEGSCKGKKKGKKKDKKKGKKGKDVTSSSSSSDEKKCKKTDPEVPVSEAPIDRRD